MAAGGGKRRDRNHLYLNVALAWSRAMWFLCANGNSPLAPARSVGREEKRRGAYASIFTRIYREILGCGEMPQASMFDALKWC